MDARRAPQLTFGPGAQFSRSGGPQQGRGDRIQRVSDSKLWDTVIVGGGLAGLSAGIYLGRAQREALIISSGNSMAVWEPEVRNYLGFPEGVSGEELIERGRRQACAFGASFAEDRIESIAGGDNSFVLTGARQAYRARKVLLATGIYHLPPEIPGVKECLGHSMFFCKDCDGLRVLEKRVAVYGHNDETVEYALGLLQYSPLVMIATNARAPRWSTRHQGWLGQYEIPVYTERITEVCHEGCQLESLLFENGDRIAIDALFTTRGDIFFSDLAKAAGANVSGEGEIETDSCQMTTVPGLYAAGCVTAANCQMIIAAGQGAIAGQAINRKLFEESLVSHRLRIFRRKQIDGADTTPDVIAQGPAA